MITISTPNYEIVTVNGKDYVIFYPQFLKDGDWATVGDENPLPVKIVELDTFNDLTKSLRETSEQNEEKLEQLNELISEMSMLSRGPKGDKGDPGPPNLEAQKDIDDHKQDKNNPHEVTKSQIGLSNVQNYGIALESQAKAGVSNAVYMTPLRTKQAIDEQRPVLIPRKTADVAGSEYPVGVSFMDIEGYGVSDGYPQNYGTVVTYKSADSRISQDFIGNGFNENQEDKWMRHYHPNNANNGWTEWKKQVQEDQVRLIADKRITEDEVLIIYEDGTFEQEGTYLAKDMTIDTKIGEVYRSSNISLPDPYAQPSTSFFNLSISGEHNTWLTRIADNNFVIVRLASFLERTTPRDYLLSYRYFGRWK